jgi:3-oxoacyl-[acyl-carrier protein] reductase
MDGKTALVTGAGRGIGRAIALGLARSGAQLALVARSRDELDQTAGQVQGLGGKALVIPADVGDPGQLTAAAGRARAELGDVDVLINNAAVVAPLGASPGIERAQWAAAIGVNVVAVANLSFLLLPAMIANGWGRIVNISSGIAAHPAGMLRAYATSKAALEARAGPGPDWRRTARAVHRLLPGRMPDRPATVRRVAPRPPGHRRQRAHLERF